MTVYSAHDIQIARDVATLTADMAHVKSALPAILEALERIERNCNTRGMCRDVISSASSPGQPTLRGRVWGVLAGVPGMVTTVALALIAAAGPILDGAAKLVAVVMSYINAKP